MTDLELPDYPRESQIVESHDRSAMRLIGRTLIVCAIVTIWLASLIVIYWAGDTAGYNRSDLEWSEYHNSEYRNSCATT